MAKATGVAFSMDFRRAVARAYDGGDTPAEVAEQFGCSASFVRKLVARRAATGTLEPKPLGRKGDQRAYDAGDEAAIRGLIAARPDATLAEVAAAVGKPACPGTVCRTLKRLGLPRKKSRSTRRSGTARTSPPAGPAGSTRSATTGPPT